MKLIKKIFTVLFCSEAYAIYSALFMAFFLMFSFLGDYIKELEAAYFSLMLLIMSLIIYIREKQAP